MQVVLDLTHGRFDSRVVAAGRGCHLAFRVGLVEIDQHCVRAELCSIDRVGVIWLLQSPLGSPGGCG